jgi:ADP-ribose pyrophosphatase YjhB (NUDIX family)
MPRRKDYWDDPKAPKPTSRKASASVLVQDDKSRVLLLRRTDNGLWTIPTGAVKKNETVAQAAVRECREETGLEIQPVGLVGVFSDPRHIIEYKKEVRQPINICLRAVVIGGRLTTTNEASAVEWVGCDELDRYEIHPAVRLRITHGLTSSEPHW